MYIFFQDYITLNYTRQQLMWVLNGNKTIKLLIGVLLCYKLFLRFEFSRILNSYMCIVYLRQHSRTLYWTKNIVFAIHIYDIIKMFFHSRSKIRFFFTIFTHFGMTDYLTYLHKLTINADTFVAFIFIFYSLLLPEF